MIQFDSSIHFTHTHAKNPSTQKPESDGWGGYLTTSIVRNETYKTIASEESNSFNPFDFNPLDSDSQGSSLILFWFHWAIIQEILF